ncbi:MAG: hypothetical protein ACK41S_05145 [Planctomycetota bacterium]
MEKMKRQKDIRAKKFQGKKISGQKDGRGFHFFAVQFFCRPLTSLHLSDADAA